MEFEECANCGQEIVFGGVTESGLRFCSKECHEIGMLNLSPQDIIDKQVKRPSKKPKGVWDLFGSPMIRKTGQWWKVQIGIMGFIIMAFSMFLCESSFKKYGYIIETIAYMGILIGLLGVIFMVAAVKCPNCKAKWIWLIIRNGGTPKKWGRGGSFSSHEICPECDDLPKIT